MQIDVIVLRQGTNHSIAAWRSWTEANGKFYARNQQGTPVPTEEMWQDLAFTINRLACDDTPTPVDVFLYLRDPLVESLYNYALLKEIVSEARNHAWAGNLYLAWDQEGNTFPKAYPGRAYAGKTHDGNAIRLEKWFRTLSEEGVTDLIEITKETKSKYSDALNLLRECGDATQERRRDLRGLVTKGGWGVVLRNEASFLKDFIKLLVKKGELLPSDPENNVVFFDQKPHFGLIELLDKSRKLSGNGNRFITTLSRVNSEELKYLCDREGLNEPFDFNGTFEWLYALIRLNQASRASVPISLVDLGHEYFEWVDPTEAMLFSPQLYPENLRLLVSSAFHHKEGEGYCLAAAREIGALLHGMRFHIDIEVCPCITIDRLPRVLEAGPFTAWLHLSHGKNVEGLYEAGAGGYASPDRWLRCFNAYRGSLQLVVLSACESAGLARLFAASGVRVAIGFESEVLTEATRILTEKVIPAALQPGDRQGAIIAAFQEACRSLSSRTYLHGGAQRSYIDARPRAFAARVKQS